jgi:hypothetical protein
MDPMSGELPREIEVALKALDAKAAERATRVDPDRVAARVLERLRHEGEAEARRAWWMAPPALRVAAAIVLLVAAGAAVKTMVDRSQQPTAIRLPVAIPAMDSLNTGQLEAVLRAAGEVRAANFAPVPASNSALDNLSEQELQKVLASLGDAEG